MSSGGHAKKVSIECTDGKWRSFNEKEIPHDVHGDRPVSITATDGKDYSVYPKDIPHIEHSGKWYASSAAKITGTFLVLCFLTNVGRSMLSALIGGTLEGIVHVVGPYFVIVLLIIGLLYLGKKGWVATFPGKKGGDHGHAKKDGGHH